MADEVERVVSVNDAHAKFSNELHKIANYISNHTLPTFADTLFDANKLALFKHEFDHFLSATGWNMTATGYAHSGTVSHGHYSVNIAHSDPQSPRLYSPGTGYNLPHFTFIESVNVFYLTGSGEQGFRHQFIYQTTESINALHKAINSV